MCEQNDWLGAIGDLAFSVHSMAELHQRGSYARENAVNVARGIEARLRWIQERAKLELKRDKVYNGRDLTVTL